jgi:DNA polymerase I-like protein with 3'-5' exonuclease and polymerase domains/uracil-DNA glycosylase
VLAKPPTCLTCPLYGDGKGFVPDLLIPGSKLTILAMSPGKNDEQGKRMVGYDAKHPIYEQVEPQPLIGMTGYQLRETYLPLTGEKEVSICHVIKCRYQMNGKRVDYLPKGDVLKAAVNHCTTAHLSIPATTSLVVTMGGPAFEYTQPILSKTHRALSKPSMKEGEKVTGGPIEKWRGFLGPQYVQSQRTTLNVDSVDGARVHEGIPIFAVEDIADFFKAPAKRITARLDWKRIGRYLRKEWPKEIPGRYVAAGDVEAVHAAFDRARQAPFVVIDTEYNPVTKFLNMIGIGWRSNDGDVQGIQLTWVGDASVTSEVRSTFIKRLADLVKGVKVVFQNAKADLPIIAQNLHIHWSKYKAIEDTMHMHSVLWSEMRHGLGFLASIYGQYPKLKHLAGEDELLYNWGDVIETLVVYEALMREFKADPLTYQVYTSQSLPLIPITLEREVKGIQIDQARLNELITKYQSHADDFETMASVYAGYDINLMSTGTKGQLARHLKAYEGIELKSVDEETIATERDKYLPFNREQEDKYGFTREYILHRIEQGASPLLELRAACVFYQQALNQDLLPIRGQERVYPSFRHDAQASGRWSTTHPALAKVPNDFLPIYVPDEGYVLFGADYDAQEPRIFMAEAKSEYLKKAFNEKLDIHTLLVCDMFGWPYPTNQANPHSSTEDVAWREQVGWGGKEDKRRTVSKNVRYERYYMGTGNNAIRKAVKLGVPKEAMERASRLVIQQDPNVADFHRAIKKQAKTKRIRSWSNRLRVFFGQGQSVEREACNHKMQAGGVDILNLGIIETIQTYPFLTMFYTRHDSFFFEVPISKFTTELAEGIRRICEQPRLINGMAVPFPGSWKTMNHSGEIASYKFNKEVKVA